MSLLIPVIDAALDDAKMMDRGYALMSVRALKIIRERLEKLNDYERRDFADQAAGGKVGGAEPGEPGR